MVMFTPPPPVPDEEQLQAEQPATSFVPPPPVPDPEAFSPPPPVPDEEFTPPPAVPDEEPFLDRAMETAATFMSGMGEGALGGGAGELYGAVYGLGDKITAILGGEESPPLKELYYEHQSEFDEVKKYLEEKHGTAATLGQVTGAIAGLGLAGAKVAAAGTAAISAAGTTASAAKAFAATLATETAIGALSGGLSSEVKLTDSNRVDLIKDVGVGAGYGLGLTTAFGAFGLATRKLVESGQTRLSKFIVNNLAGTGAELDHAIEASRSKAKESEELLERWVLGDKGEAPWLGSLQDTVKTIPEDAKVGLKTTLFRKQAAEVAGDVVHEGRVLGIQDVVSDEDLYKALRAKRVEFGNSAFQKLSSRNMNDAFDQVSMAIKREGHEFADKAWDQFRVYEHSIAAMQDVIIPQSSTAVGKSLRRAAMFFADSKYVFRAIDERWDLSLEPVHNALTRAHDMMTVVTAANSEKVKKLMKESRKAGLLEEVEHTHTTPISEAAAASSESVSASKLFHAMSAEDFKDLTPAQVVVVDKWRELFKGLREFGQSFGLNIEDKGAFYLPMRSKDVVEFATAIKEKLPKNYLTMTKDQFDQMLHGEKVLTSPSRGVARVGGDPWGESDISQVLKALESVAGRPIKTLKTFKKAVLKLNDFEHMRASANTAASASFHRGDVPIPAFVRETDVAKLAVGWAANTFKHAYMREPLAELRNAQKILGRVSESGLKADANAASYLKNFIQDVSGTRTGTLASWTQATVDQQKSNLLYAARNSTGVTSVIAKMAYGTDWLFSEMLKNIYPAYLGMSARAILRNSTQPNLLTALEAAGSGGGVAERVAAVAYAQRLTLAAQVDALGTHVTGTEIRLSKHMAESLGKKEGDLIVGRGAMLMRNEGFAPAKFTGEIAGDMDPVSTVGRELSKIGGGIKEVVRAQAEWSMYLYELSDIHNRMVTCNVARHLNADIISALSKSKTGERLTGDEGLATRFLTSMPKSFQRQAHGLMSTVSSLPAHSDGSARAKEQLGKMMADYLNSTTQFSYSKVAMSEYGRFMGSVFSMFTKWPLSVTSNVVSTHQAALRRESSAVRGHVTGFADNVQKYFGPLVGLGLLDKILLGGKENYSDQNKALLGSQGLWQWAPGASAIDFVTGKTFKVPAVDMLATLGDLVYNNRNGGINNAMEKSFRSYTPGVAWARFMLEDVPALMGKDFDKEDGGKPIHKAFMAEPEPKPVKDELTKASEQEQRNQRKSLKEMMGE